MNYHISSLQHPLVKHLVKLRQRKSYRYEQQAILIEGIKPVAEICQHTSAKMIMTYDRNLLPENIQTDKLLVVPEDILKKISGMVHSEGVLAEFLMPAQSDLKTMSPLLVLDGINDPGNLGTLLRTALALGWQGVFIVGEGCDLYNEKTLRAARGAHFRLPLRQGSWPELKALADRNHLMPLLADLEGASPQDLNMDNKILLILSNEARGPSNEAMEWCQRVTIPISGKMESLNVSAAGAILMYLLQQQGKTYGS
ncbi:MAG: RNA methyltransferase [Parachlamydiaceae bacterium]|nr:RNA methyltransferase [Parachlamydiaceae bacterium]